MNLPMREFLNSGKTGRELLVNLSLRGASFRATRQSFFMTVCHYFVYIATNFTNTVLYTGVTNHLPRRISEHKLHYGSVFTRKYRINKLVYYEEYTDIREAIKREKQLKSGSRKKKLNLIDSINPSYEDLSTNIF